jgi:alkaline phosphatase
LGIVALVVMLAGAVRVEAAPNVSRLTPPSNDPSIGGATLARFLPGQRFDLQATVQPDADAQIKSVRFAVDGRAVAALDNDGSPNDQFSRTMSLVKKGLITELPPNTVVASLRAYAHTVPGLHTLTVTATDTNGASSVKTGVFEIVGIAGRSGSARNIIIMLGDGMGAAHRTAARIMARGYRQGKAQGRLAMDTLPHTAMVMTAALNSIVTDSAPGMSNYVTGNKAQNNQEGVFPDDTLAVFDNPRIEYLSEYLHRRRGTSLGLVTTADVFDATPAANAVHSGSRSNGTGIVDQYLDDRGLTGLKVLMGGGRKWFLPKQAAQSAGSDNSGRSFGTTPAGLVSTANGSARTSASDYVLPPDIVAGWGASPGSIDVDRDLIADFKSAGFAYVPDHTALAAVGTPDKLLGLFSLSNMNVALDKIGGRRGSSSVVSDYGFPDQPLLEEMTEAALRVLSKNNRNGFVLMVEGASIDKQSHLMDSDRWIMETIEFDRAVQKAKDFAMHHPDTILIVTADHECSGAAIIGASLKPVSALDAIANGADHSPAAQRDAVVGVYEGARFPHYTIAADGFPASTDVDGKMLIGYGANADRYEAWLAQPQPTQDTQQPFVGTAPLDGYPGSPGTRNSGNGVKTGPKAQGASPRVGYLITGQVPGELAVHTGTDVPLSAFGRGASLFSGVIDNTDVFFKLGQIALGRVK